MKLPISKKFKLRNKTFVWKGRVRNVINQMKIKWHLPPDVSERFHIENKTEVRNYNLNDQNS